MTVQSPQLLITEPRPLPPAGWPVWRLAFRPFYLAGALAAAGLIALWLLVVWGQFELGAEVSPVLWHAHEMVYGFVVAIVVGFLFTAGKTWTGQDTPRGQHLAALLALWLAGRVAGVLGDAHQFFFWDVAFLPLVTVTFVQILVRVRQWRNLPIAGILAALSLCNLLFHLGALEVLDLPPMQALHGAIALVTMLIVVMTGRVVPMFTRNAFAGIDIAVQPWRERFVLASTAAALLLWVLAAPAVAVAAACGLAALGQASRVWAWRSHKTWRKPLVWTLHLSHAWLPMAFVLLALASLGWLAPSVAVHALTVGVVGGVIAAMITRTARGHTGRPLQASVWDVGVFALLPMAALLRVGAGLVDPAFYSGALLASGVLWVLAFVLYLCRYTPWLLSTRVDGKDG